MKALQGVFLWQIALMPIATAYAINTNRNVAAAFYLGVLLTSAVCFIISLFTEEK